MAQRRAATTRTAGALVGTVAAALLLSACGGSDAGAASSGSEAVKVGLLANLTGSAAPSFGKPFKQGFELALKEAAAAGVKTKIELVVEDARSEVPGAVTGFNKLAQANVPIVINDSQSPLGQAVAPLANDRKIAFLSGAGSKLENQAGYAFRFTDLATPTADMAKKLVADGASRVGVVVAKDNPSFDGLAKATEAGLPQGFTERVEVNSADTDFAAVLANLRQADLDAIVLSVLPAQAGNIILQMKQSGGFEDVRLAGTLALSTETFTIAREAANGLIFPQVWAPGAATTKAFEDAFNKAYGENPTAYGALGYQVAWIVLSALESTSSSDPNGQTLRDALPAASQSALVKEHGILDLALNADGSAKSTGALATFSDSGQMVVADAG